jgi:Flp pilus assembly pilin Flp
MFRRAQSMIEYAILIGLVVAAVVGLGALITTFITGSFTNAGL